MDNIKIVYKTVQSLIPYANNARVHSDSQVQLLAKSIQEFGFNNPILLDDKDTVIAGHGRVLAANLVGMKKVPCIVLAHLSDRQRKAYILADNKIALRSTWDMEKLSTELGELADLGIDLELTGFDEQELDTILRSEIILPEFRTEPEQPQRQEPQTAAPQEAVDAPPPPQLLPVANFSDEGISYKRQYGVTVICDDENKQAELFERLTAEGLNCRIVVT